MPDKIRTTGNEPSSSLNVQAANKAPRRSLGRGLGALLPNTPTAAPKPTTSSTATEIDKVPVSAIRTSPYQPRIHFKEEALKELSASIKNQGLLQPLVLKREADGKYTLIAGERRLRASKLAGLSEVPAVIRKVTSREMLEMALVENIQREDLNPIEEARGYAMLIEELGLSQEQAAERVGKSRPAVANSLRLLKLPVSIQDDLEAGRLTAGHARALLTVADEKARMKLRKELLAGSATVREAEGLARAGSGKKRRKAKKPALEANLEAARAKLQQKFGTRVEVDKNGARGSVRIHFFSDDDLMRIFQLLNS